MGLCAGRELLRFVAGASSVLGAAWLCFSAARGCVGGSLSYRIGCGTVGSSLRRSIFSTWPGPILYRVEIRSTGGGNELRVAGFEGFSERLDLDEMIREIVGSLKELSN